MSRKSLGKFLRDSFFTRIENDEGPTNDWICQCEALRSVKGSGYSNFTSHLKKKHPEGYEKAVEYYKKADNLSQLDVAPFSLWYPEKSIKVYGWIEFVALALQPISVVENDRITKHIKYGSLSVKSLKKYMNLLAEKVEKKLAEILPSKFALIFDGWTAGDTHYVALYASFSSNNDLGFSTALLSFAPLDTETSQSAKAHQKYIEYVLNLYGKSMSNVAAIVGDNCNTNRALAKLCMVGFVGCASHRYNLAYKDLLTPQKDIIEKVSKVMKKFGNPIPAAKLRKLTTIKPKLHVVTRWSSTVDMMRRYAELRDYICDVEIDGLDEMLLSVRENKILDKFCSSFTDIDSITKALQSDALTISEVRCYFDSIIEIYPGTISRLGPQCAIVEQPNFESALIKIQEMRINEMSKLEVESVKHLRINSGNNPDQDRNKTLAERSLSRRRASTSNRVSYQDVRFILPTSNICERLFSIADHALPARRRSLHPTTFETQLFLRENEEYWELKDVHSVVM